MSERQPGRKASIANTAEALWQDIPGHFDGAYSKMLVHPDNADTRHFDYRISVYQPKGYVETHSHRIQEQVYHILAGEALMELDGARRVVRVNDVIFIPPGIPHAIYNTGLSDLTFIVVTTPPVDSEN